MAELKPCPFCGTVPIIIREYGMTQVKCNNFECWILPGTSYYMNEEIAFNAWNRRHEEPKQGVKPDDFCSYGERRTDNGEPASAK